MTIRIALNGLNQFSRVLLRHVAQSEQDVEVVAINDLADMETLCTLLKYDSVYGRFPGEVTAGRGELIVNGRSIRVLTERNVAQLPWAPLAPDIVVETGWLLQREGSRSYVAHLEAGAKRVLITGMARQPDLFFVRGANEHQLSAEMNCISMGGRVLHSLAPVCKLINEQFGIETGDVTALLPISQDQSIQDIARPFSPYGRAAAVNIVASPISTDWNLGRVIPELNAQITGLNYRVPVYGGGMIQLTLSTRNQTDSSEINAAIRHATEERLRGIIECTDDPIVSRDVLGCSQSCVVDLNLTGVQKGSHLRLAWWFDPNWSLAARTVEAIQAIGMR